MCLTFDHSYGEPTRDDGLGMTHQEKEYLFNTMAGIFEKDIMPHMTYRNINGPLD
jgi:hypothetical protein